MMNVSHSVQFFKRKTHHKVSFFFLKRMLRVEQCLICLQFYLSNYIVTTRALDVALWRTRLLISLQFMTSFVGEKLRYFCKCLGPTSTNTTTVHIPPIPIIEFASVVLLEGVLVPSHTWKVPMYLCSSGSNARGGALEGCRVSSKSSSWKESCWNERKRIIFPPKTWLIWLD